MPKIPVHFFKIPLAKVASAPFRTDPEDKNFWFDYAFEDVEFPLDKLTILEIGKDFHVKNIRRTEGGKTQLQFKGVAEKAVKSGQHLYDSRWPVTFEKKAYLVPLGAQNQRFKADKARLKCRLTGETSADVELKKIPGPDDKYLIQVFSHRSFPCLTGLLYLLEMEDGTVLETALLTAGTVESRDLSDYLAKTFRFKGLPSVNALYSINLRVMGWTQLPPPLWDEEFEEAQGEEGVRIMTKAFAHYAKKAKNAASQPGGIRIDALQDKMNLPEKVYGQLVFRMIKEGILRRREDWLMPVADPQTYLSPVAKKVMERLETAGAAGVDPGNIHDFLIKRTLDELVRMDLALVTETPWYYAPSGWQKVRQLLCGPGTLGKLWKIAEVKELLDCSRKPILGILNRLESEGLLLWKEDCREVIKEVSAANPE